MTTSSNPYYSFISSTSFIREFPFYGDSYKELARSLVPWDRFLEDFQKLNKNLKNELGDQTDYCLIRLLEWFKSDLFTWVNSLFCEKCSDQECRLIGNRPAMGLEFNCFKIELYKCPNCNCFYEFPRYNHGGKLLQTRRGRCGEWALAFAYLCFVWDYEIRMIYHFDDHVWVEVYSKSKHKWIHCDPCENAYDNPLMYECGWNKRSSLIIAHGMYEVRDVTWRYVSKWRQTLQYRNQLFNENQIIAILNRLNVSLQSKLNANQRVKITERWLAELTEFLRSPDQEVLEAQPKALQGRISGSIQWRLSRRETSIEPKYVFTLNVDFESTENRSGTERQSMILYDCSQDSYMVKKYNVKQQETLIINQWNTACYQSENVFRMVEHDWKMCYLSRHKHCNAEDIGRIRWRIEFNSVIKWKSIQILIKGQTFESGIIELEFIHANYQQKFYPNKIFQLNYEDLINETEIEKDQNRKPSGMVRYFDIEARLMSGEGQLAWQHAQLFRQTTKTKNRDDMFKIIVNY